MDGVAIKALAKKLRQHDQNLRELEDFIKRANRLFTPENLVQFAVLFTKPHEQKLLRNMQIILLEHLTLIRASGIFVLKLCEV